MKLVASRPRLRLLIRSAAASTALSLTLSLLGCGMLLGESFDGYSNRDSAGGGGSANDAASADGGSANGAASGGGGPANAALAGAGAGDGGSDSDKAGNATDGGAPVLGVGAASGESDHAGSGIGGVGRGFGAGGSGAGAPTRPDVAPSCALPGGALIADMEGPWRLDTFYANPQAQHGVLQISGFFCGRSSAISDQETVACALDSQIETTTNPDEVHGGQTALKAHANGTRRLLVKMDIEVSFDASQFGGIHFWAKGSGPFVPGIDGGGDWRGLPDLKPDTWQEYCLSWNDLVDSSTLLPLAFDGRLDGKQATLDANQAIAFQVWDPSESGDFELLLDDLAFLAK